MLLVARWSEAFRSQASRTHDPIAASCGLRSCCSCCRRPSRRTACGRAAQDEDSVCCLPRRGAFPYSATPISRSSRTWSCSNSLLAQRCTISPWSITRQRSELASAISYFCSTIKIARSPCVAHAGDRRHQFLHHQRRKPFDRLVEQQQRRVGRERARDREHLLLAAGELIAGVAAAGGETRKKVVERVRRPGPGPRHDREILLDRQRRRTPRVPAAPSRCRAGCGDSAGSASTRSPCSEISPPWMRGQSAQRFDQRCLADAVAADDDQHFAARDREIDAVQDARRAIAGRQAFDRERGLLRRQGRPPARAGGCARFSGVSCTTRAPAANTDTMIGVAKHDIHVVLDEQHRCPADQVASCAKQLMALLGRQSGSRLVEQQYLRLERQRQRHLEQTLLAVRQRVGHRQRVVGEAELREQRDRLVDQPGFPRDRAQRRRRLCPRVRRAQARASPAG